MAMPCQRALHPSYASLDHLVGEREQLVGDLEAERLGGLEIEHKLELGGAHHRKVGGLFALEDATGVDAGLPISLAVAGAIADQATGDSLLAIEIHRGNGMASGQR